MFADLLEDKHKNKVVGFFAVRPERGFFLAELRKKIGQGSRVISDLNFLAKEQVLRQYQRKGAKYFRLNKRGPYYESIKAWAKKLKLKAQDELEKLVKKMPGIKMVVLTGVFVGPEKTECDALLVGKFTQRQLQKFEKQVEQIIGQEINYAVMDYNEYKMRKDTFDRFMKDIFENEHVILIDKTK